MNDRAIATTVLVDKESPGGFGSLIALLEAVCINYEVRLRPAAWSSFLTNASVGNRHHPKKGRRPSLTRGCIGGTILFGSR